MNAGELREVLQLQDPPAVDDGSGGQIGDWTTVAKPRAKVEAQRGDEAAQAAIAIMTVQFRVTMRRRAIGAGQRLVWTTGGETWTMDVRALLPQTDRAWTVLLCEGRLAA